MCKIALSGRTHSHQKESPIRMTAPHLAHDGSHLRKRGLTPLFLSLVSKKEFEHEIGSDSQLITPIFGCFVAVRRVLAQCGRIYGVNGRFHLTMLNKASNINARLAFLAKPL